MTGLNGADLEKIGRLFLVHAHTDLEHSFLEDVRSFTKSVLRNALEMNEDITFEDIEGFFTMFKANENMFALIQEIKEEMG